MSTQGKCPHCGADLHNDGRVLAGDDGHSEPVSCPQCGWHGYENYAETFVGHDDPDPDDPHFAPPWSPSYHVAQDYAIKPPPEDKTEDGTRVYRVVYEIDVYAGSPLDAARQVQEIFHDPGCEPCFMVLDGEGRQTVVDLFAEGLDERYGPALEIRRVDGETAIPRNPETPA